MKAKLFHANHSVDKAAVIRMKRALAMAARILARDGVWAMRGEAFTDDELDVVEAGIGEPVRERKAAS